MALETRPPRAARARGVRAIVLVFTLGLLLFAAPAADAGKTTAKDLLLKGAGGALSGAASWGAELVLNAIAAGIYDASCGEDQVTDAFSEMLCSIAGETTGRSDEEWRARIEDKLDQIQGQLDQVLRGQEEIESAIARQTTALQEELSALPSLVRAHNDLANIEAAWDAFTEYFATVRPESPERALESQRQLARRLVDNSAYNIEASVRDLRLAIQQGSAGQAPLPLLMAQRIYAWGQTGPEAARWDGMDPESFDVAPHYAELELAVRLWLMRQRQAQVLLLWCARVLEGTPDALPQSAREYGRAHRESLERQLESFQRGVEWLVLAHSFPRGPFADFLPTNAEQVFRRADALQAIQLSLPDDLAERSPGQAIWGRVIAMGSGPGGALTLRAPRTNRSVPLQATGGHELSLGRWEELDWWTASDPRQPRVYDVVHFGNRWTVYRFKLPLENDAALGDYRLSPEDAGNALPYLPPVVSVDNSLTEITERASERFGSFVGVARAGGAYALFSGEFEDHRFDQLDVTPTRARDRVDRRKSVRRIDTTRGTMPRAVLGERSAIHPPLESAGLGVPVTAPISVAVKRSYRIRLTSRKTVRPGSGEDTELRLHAVWNGDTLGADAFDQPADRILVVSAARTSGGRPARPKVSASLGVTLSGDWQISPANGLRLQVTGAGEVPVDAFETREAGRTEESAQGVFLPAGGSPVSLGVAVSVELPSSPNDRVWTLLARMPLQTVYLAR